MDTHDGEEHPGKECRLANAPAAQVSIRRQGQQASILYRPAHGEVIQILKLVAG